MIKQNSKAHACCKTCKTTAQPEAGTERGRTPLSPENDRSVLLVSEWNQPAGMCKFSATLDSEVVVSKQCSSCMAAAPRRPPEELHVHCLGAPD